MPGSGTTGTHPLLKGMMLVRLGGGEYLMTPVVNKRATCAALCSLALCFSSAGAGHPESDPLAEKKRWDAHKNQTDEISRNLRDGATRTYTDHTPQALENAKKAVESEDNDHRIVNLARYEDVEKRAGQDSELTLIVAISGGGYRAANFALGALLALEQIAYEKPNGPLQSVWQPDRRQGSNLLNEVDYFSTVSGGGLAAAVAVMSRLRAPKIEGLEESELACSGHGRQLLTNWLSQPGVLKSLRENHMIRLITSKFSPSVMLTRKTSGDALQMRLDQSILRSEEQGGVCGPKKAGEQYELGDVLPRAREDDEDNDNEDDKPFRPKAPYLFMNSTDFATGEIVSLTPDWLERKNVTEYWHDGSRKLCAKGKHCGAFNVPLALALRSSMNFPVGIPPTRIGLSNKKFVYLTDGGESDNLGTVTAVDILNQESKDHPSRRRMLIVIDAFRGLGSKQYDTKKMPGLVNSVLRATSLPLDAHRLRVKQDFYSAAARQLSVLDAISDAGDVSVAYIDMEEEPQALAIGTSLGLKQEQQIALICAGIRQTFAALGMSKSWDQVRKTTILPSGANSICPKKSNSGNVSNEQVAQRVPKQGIVAFNRQSKTELIGHLATRFTETMRLVRSSVVQLTPDLKDSIETNSRRHRRDRILADAALARKSLEAPKVKLTAEDLSAFEWVLGQYASQVDSVLNQLHRKSLENATDEESVVDEDPWYVKFVKWLWGLGKSDDEDVGNASMPEGGRVDVSSVSDPNSDEKLKQIIEALEAMSEGAKRINQELRKIKEKLASMAESAELGGLQGKILDLNTDHEKLLILVVGLETGDTKQLGELFNGLLELIGSPQKKLVELQEKLNTKFEDALKKQADASNEIVSEVEKKLENLENLVEADVNMFKEANVWRGALKVAKRVESVRDRDTERASREGRICTFLRDSREQLVKARRQLDALDDGSVDMETAWGVDPNIANQTLRTRLRRQKQTIGEEVEKGIAEATNLWCIWPDLEKRDRYTYENFLSFRSMNEFKDKGCKTRAELPYEPACSHSDPTRATGTQ